LKLFVQHGSDIHTIELKYKINEQQLIVADLQVEVEKATLVPINGQRIFFKHRELQKEPHETLKEFEIEQNVTVKLVGVPKKNVYQNYSTTNNINNH
jgi:hypothetical protein